MSSALKNQASAYPWWYHLLSIIIIVGITAAYFYPQFEGKKVQQGDIISSEGKSSEPLHYMEEGDDLFLWNNGQFGGMPFLLAAPAKNNLIVPLYKVFKLGFDEPVGLFIAMMGFSYLMFLLLGLHPILSLFLAISIGLSTNNLILWEAGHNSKVRTLAYTPLIIAGILYVFEHRKYLIGGGLLALGFGLSVYARHPQMTYYLFMVFAVYGFIKLIHTIVSKEWKPFLTGTGIVVLASLLALGASASKLMCMYEYNKSSMRGKPVIQQDIQKNTTATSSSQVDGLDWEYAMQWSNTVEDLIASFIPGFAGGGSGEKVSAGYLFNDRYRMQQAPLYWGGLPFTSGPIYFGAVLIFLFVFGLFYLKGDLKWWLGIGVFLTLLLSMGKHFSVLNKPLFDYLPMYNKFRTPQSILSVTIFFIPVLAGLSLRKMLQVKQSVKIGKKNRQLVIPDDLKKSLIRAAAITGGFALLMALFGPNLFDMTSPSDARYIQQGVDPDVFAHDRAKLMRADSWRTFMLIVFAFGTLWAYIQRKLPALAMMGIIGALITYDFWTIGTRYLDHNDFVDTGKYAQNFAPRPVDQQIMAQEKGREYYRVLDLSINTFNSTYTTNFHNHIGGYHPAKLQRYQDVIERHISNNNQAVLDMLNTKYIINKDLSGKEIAQVNPGALGNAWFVEEIQKVKTPKEEIEALSSFNPAQTAIVLDSEFENYIGDFEPIKDKNGLVALTAYKPDHLTYTYGALNEQVVVFSETWYGPELGWQAFIDGSPVPHIRANFIQRAMRIPAGEHTIEFKFNPACYRIGERVSLICSLLMIVGLLGVTLVFVKPVFLKKESNSRIKNQ